MAGYMPQPDIYPPSWSFDIHSPGKWTWEAPTTAQQRATRQNKTNVAAVFKSILTWLEDADAAKPFLTPPVDEVAQDAKGATEAIIDSTPIAIEIQQLKTTLAEMEDLDRAALLSFTRECAVSLKSRIEGGYLTPDEISHAANPFSVTEKLQLAGHDIEHHLTLILRRAIRAGLLNMSTTSGHTWTDDDWLLLLTRFSRLAVRNEDTSGALARTLISSMPPQLRQQIPDANLLPLWESMLRAKATGSIDCEKFGQTAAQAWALGQQLKEMPLSQLLRLENHLSGISKQDFSSPHLRSSMSKFFTLVIANVPAFSDIIAADSHSESASSISATRALQLTLARLSALDLLDQDLIKQLTKDWNPLFHKQWANVITKLERARGSSGIATFCAAAKEAGYLNHIIAGLTEAPMTATILKVTAMFIRECNDSETALDMILNLEATGWLQPWFQNWSISASHVEQWILNPNTQGRVLQALCLGDMYYRAGAWECETLEQKKAQLNLLRKMSATYLRAEHLTRRQCLRRLKLCLDMERRLSGTPSEETLTGIVLNVTSQLENGSFGSKERLRWVIELIEKEQGKKAAARCRTLLQGWRDSNAARQGLPRVLATL